MPLYQYRAQDNQGKEVQGSVSANDLSKAQSVLVGRGLRIFDLAEKGAAVQTATPSQSRFQGTAGPQSSPQQEVSPVAARVAARAATAQAGPQRVNMPAAAPVRIVYTSKGSDKTNGFIFSQLVSYFKAGVNAGDALQQVGQRQPNPDYKQSLLEASKETMEGVRFSRVLERYPDLYMPHVAGIMKAGEEGGFVVEAAAAVAEQADASRNFKKWFTALYWWTLANVVLMPPGWLMVRAALDSWDVQDRTGGTANGWKVLFASMGQSIKWPVGPLTVVLILVLYGLSKWLGSRGMALWRHRLVLKIPTVGKRARSESLALFAWTLSMVSRAGVAPRTAWALAVGAMPNLEIKRRMQQVGEAMSDGSKLSTTLYETKLVPLEYAPMVETGEITGDVATALLQVSQATRDDFKLNENMAKGRIGCWGFLVMCLVGLFLAYVVFGVFYPQLIHKVTGD